MGSKNSKGRQEVRLRPVFVQRQAGAPGREITPAAQQPAAAAAAASWSPSRQPLQPTLVAATPHGTEKILAIDRARILVQSDTNPFECIICLNLYNDGENIPTTFPCGHSMCLVHVTAVRCCPLCRSPIPPAAACRPTIALRDAAMLFAQVTAEAMARCEEEGGDEEGSRQNHDGEEVWLRREGSWELAELQIDRHQASSSSGDFGGSHQPPAAVAAADGAASGPRRSHAEVSAVAAAAAAAKQAQLTRDAALAREMYSREQQERAAQLARDEELARELQRREQLEAASSTVSTQVQAPERLAPPPAPAAVASAGTSRAPPRLLNCAECGKSCFLSARLRKCCACLDRRPVQIPDGTYPVYVDGVGWQNIGRRCAGYCPACS